MCSRTTSWTSGDLRLEAAVTRCALRRSALASMTAAIRSASTLDAYVNEVRLRVARSRNSTANFTEPSVWTRFRILAMINNPPPSQHIDYASSTFWVFPQVRECPRGDLNPHAPKGTSTSS